ncbi:hypothetical protein ANN_05927 [Periplaneta americana]|uniref:Uncharacterized protein n=1 Tax=Periplaneta americana TaxID=6978 RepID=A0ABQ8TDX4_PERAM|nr:hypothetical protein ANN_05927 [Periplaneta americana]
MATVFFDSEGLLLVDIIPLGTTINSDGYVATLKKLQVRLSRVRRHREKQDVLLLHDNAQPYVCLGIHDGMVHAFSRSSVDSGQQNPTPMFQHSLQNIMRFSHAYNNHCTFMYLLRDPVEPLLYCYLYQASDPNDVYRRNQLLSERQLKPRRVRKWGAGDHDSASIVQSTGFRAAFLPRLQSWRSDNTVAGSYVNKLKCHVITMDIGQRCSWSSCRTQECLDVNEEQFKHLLR